IECLAKGTTTFKENWKLGAGRRKESFIPTIGKTPGEVSLSIQYDGDTFQAASTNTSAYIPAVHVLRRRSLLAFIEDDQKDRYDKVSAFMDIPAIEAAEASLREARNNAQSEFESSAGAITHAEESLNSQWEAAGSPGLGEQYTKAEEWAREEASADAAALQKAQSQLNTDISIIEKLNRPAEKILAARAELKQAQQAQQQAEQILKEIEQKAEKGSAALASLIKDAKDYLSQTPDEVCPVCEQTKIEAPKLVERLSNRLGEMAALNDASRVLQTTARTLQTKQALYEQAMQDLLQAAASALEHFGNELTEANGFNESKESEPEKAVEVAVTVNQQLSKRLSGLREEAQAIQKKLYTLGSIKSFVQTLDKKRTELEGKARLYEALKSALAIYEARRKHYIKQVLQEIGQSVDALYQQIHPGKGIGELKLVLDSKKRASLDYKVKFPGQGYVQPQPYYSESHLDTLGLCIFLALAKRSSGEDAIIVLDDLLISVDQQHMDATVKMLINESSSVAQIIITTHYRQMRDRFRFTYNSNAVQMLELKPWTLEGGIRIGRTLEAREELREKLLDENFDRQSVTSKAGILFESLLEYISLTYRCRVPHIPEQEYTFGDLASAPNSKLKNALKIVKMKGDVILETPLKSFYEQLNEAIQVRNIVGCHFNKWGADLSDDDVRVVADLAVEFADTLICDECGRLPLNRKSGSYWDCGGECKKTQMHPLQQPE
ncbi:MAG: hypothetical protein RLT30_11685, partial [Gammaproteobacteria bacterium]